MQCWIIVPTDSAALFSTKMVANSKVDEPAAQREEKTGAGHDRYICARTAVQQPASGAASVVRWSLTQLAGSVAGSIVVDWPGASV